MYDLIVRAAAWPADLDDRVTALLETVGVSIEMEEPLLEHEGGWFPVGVVLADAFAFPAPVAWLDPGVDTGFEASWLDGAFSVSAPFGATAAGWFVAAAVAVAAGGVLRDCQTAEVFRGEDLGELLGAVFASKWPAARPAPHASLAGSLVSYGRSGDGNVERREPSD